MDGRWLIVVAVVALFWALGRTQGRVRHAINRLSVIGAFVSTGLWIACFIIEVSGYIPPLEGWLGGFWAWLFIFCLIRSRTLPITVNPPAPTPDVPSESN